MKHFNRLLALLLTVCMVLAMLPSTFAAKAEDADVVVVTPENEAILQADVLGDIQSYLQPKRGVTQDEEYFYTTASDAVKQIVLDSDTYVDGSLVERGDGFFWQTTTGITCGYNPQHEYERSRMQAPAAAKNATASVLTNFNYSSAGRNDVCLIGPMYSEDDSFTEQYANEAKSIATAAGGTGYKLINTSASVTAIAQAMETCGVVIFDSHGNTDWGIFDGGSDGEGEADNSSKACTSYLCLSTGSGITSADMAYVTSPANSWDTTYCHAYTDSYGDYLVDGTAIANHMTKNAPNNMLWMAICLGMATDGICAPLRNKGVDVVYGYSQSVFFDGDYAYEGDFWSKMKSGSTVKDAIAYMKTQNGNWDTCAGYYNWTTVAQAKSNYAAFPVVASVQDTYPGRGKVDALQTVNSTWLLKAAAACTHSSTTATAAVAATCTTNGNIAYWTCNTCKKIFNSAACTTEITLASTVITATGHSWNAGTVTTPATCTTAGVKTFTCTKCSETKTESIAATGHSWNAGTVTTPATCTTAGVKTFTCSKCSETKTETIAATGHSWNAGTVTTPATCTTAGVKTFTCTKCSETKTESIAATGHVDADSNNICDVCGAVLGDTSGGNTGVRDALCTALSSQAATYYTGSYTISSLDALKGVNAPTDSYAATQSNPIYTALHNLMTDTRNSTVIKYNGWDANSLATHWMITDAEAGSSTYIYFYTDVLSTDPSVSELTMNREHVWAKSNASFYLLNGGADLHHLRPSIAGVNASKSNRAFGDLVGTEQSYSTYKVGDKEVLWTGGTDNLVEVRDNVKGDVARILLYVYVRWEQPNLYTDIASEKLPPLDTDDSQNDGKKVIESLDVLLEWCQNDPVDCWEMQRNDLVQNVQGNRNVFIDYPELAWMMFDVALPQMDTPSGYANEHGYDCLHTNTVATAAVAATCTTNGNIAYWTCSDCGRIFSDAACTVQVTLLETVITAAGHVDADNNGFCDVCGTNMGTTPPVGSGTYKLTTTLNSGDKVVLYNPGNHVALSSAKDGYNVQGVAVTPASNAISTNDATIVWLATKNADGSYTFTQDGGIILGAAASGTYYDLYTEGGSYATNWTITPTGTGSQVDISSATLSGTYGPVFLEYYNNAFKAYSTARTSTYYTLAAMGFEMYVIKGTTPPATCTHSSMIATAAVAATCTVSGNIAYWTCNSCGKIFNTAACTTEITLASTVIAATGHNWDAGVITTPATCTTAGVKTFTCTKCNETKTEPIAATGHIDADNDNICDVCGARLGPCTHDWNEGKVTKAPTCTEDGIKTYTCKLCGEEKTEAIPALGHIDTNGDGKCDVCGSEISNPQYNPFVDVSKGYYYKAVLWAVDEEITMGTDMTHFSPDASCTRGQVVTFLWRALGAPMSKEVYCDFVDVSEGTYYYQAVLWAQENDITVGVDLNHFAPEQKVSRAQFVTFLWRAMGCEKPKSKTCSFTDVKSGAYYYNAVLWAVENAITDGVDSKHFAPNATCIRAHVVTFLWREFY